MTARILVINSGSSSLKYQLLLPTAGTVLAKGLIERVTDHRVAIGTMLDELAADGIDSGTIDAVGHRVVHGGSRFPTPTRIDDDALQGIESLNPLAPLHNPAALLGIRAMLDALPSVPNVAVFDTSFHATIPAHAHTYAIDRDVAERYGIRRYGFHGTSHRYVTHRTAQLLGRPVDDVNLIVCHIGNGASVTAVQGGRSIDTSMGLTPLEGLVMGTRSGDIDAGVVFHLAREAGYDIADIDTLLNRRSGLLGMTGSGDMREVQERIDAGDAAAQLAFDVYCYRVRKYIGAYHAVLPRVDAVVFTAGVGENDDRFRADVITPLAHLGLTLDAQRNLDRAAGDRFIDAGTGGPRVLVVRTNEELAIATETAQLLGFTA